MARKEQGHFLRVPRSQAGTPVEKQKGHAERRGEAGAGDKGLGEGPHNWP